MTTTAPWYIDTWVNAPLPVMSPMAQTPSATRIRSSGSSTRRVRVEADVLEAEAGEVGATAGRDEQLLGGQLLVAEVDA